MSVEDEDFHGEGSRGRLLWLEAHEACDGNRDAMWDYVARLYFAALEATATDTPPEGDSLEAT